MRPSCSGVPPQPQRLSMPALQVLDLDDLRPYASFAVLRATENAGSGWFPRFGNLLRQKLVASARGVERRLIADRLLAPAVISHIESLGLDDVEVDGFAYRRSSTASWARDVSAFVNEADLLVLLMKWNDYVLVHAPKDRRESFFRLLRSDPPPPVARVNHRTVENALVNREEMRSIHLKNAGSHLARLPDAKHMAGPTVGQAINPTLDSSYVFTSGFSFLTDDLELEHLGDGVGSTPKNAWVWAGQCRDVREFVGKAAEVVDLIRLAEELGPSAPFPELSQRLDAHEPGIGGAFAASTLGPAEAAVGADADDLTLQAAELLIGSVKNITGYKDSLTLEADLCNSDGKVGRARS